MQIPRSSQQYDLHSGDAPVGVGVPALAGFIAVMRAQGLSSLASVAADADRLPAITSRLRPSSTTAVSLERGLCDLNSPLLASKLPSSFRCPGIGGIVQLTIRDWEAKS